MRSVKPMKTAKCGYILISVLLCILGLMIIIFPSISGNVICYILGGLMTVYGIIKLVGYFSKDLYRLAFQYDLAFGCLTMFIGIIMLAHPEGVMSFIFALIGIIILADGLFKIQMSLDAKGFGIESWWLILLFAVITGIFGLLLLLCPLWSMKVLMVFLGIALLADGLLTLFVALYTIKIVKNQKPDYIDVEYEEIRKE